MNKAAKKFFERYAESEVKQLTSFPSELMFEYAAVIPAYKEKPEFIQQFVQVQARQHACLLVLVINQPENDVDSHPQAALFEYVHTLGTNSWQSRTSDRHPVNLTLVAIRNTSSAILVVDRFSQPLPENEGVGLARKIGADILSYLYCRQQIKSPYLYSTDADATLPVTYFDATKDLVQSDVACCFNFLHASKDKKVHEANALYESALKYYVAGLRYANSPYAFFTIGSILAIRFETYIAVRGFPKKSAGEDFYLMNKVAKLGQIAWLPNDVIRLEARISDRVPFGTGPAVSKIISLQERNEAYCYYHPQVFSELKHLYEQLPQLVQKRHRITDWLAIHSNLFSSALCSIGFLSFIKKQADSTDEQFLKQFHIWFDAFKTMKFIHALRELGLDDIPLYQALEKANFD